jgi:cytochrome c oxidase cbb3-type subunit 3
VADDRKEIDEVTGIETTGHEWDGIRELNQPLPRWWLYIFYATFFFSLLFWILYPSWPGISDHSKGVLGWTRHAALEQETAEARAAQAAYLDRIAAEPTEAIAGDPELFAFAVAGGRSAFGNNCAQCHVSGAAGGTGYPNLNDDDWLWGGTLEAIETTIRYGVRSSHDETRVSDMPAFGRDELLTEEEINEAAEFVLSLSGSAFDEAAAERGATLFADNCAACHGEQGEGMQEMGAPDLSDAIWLYGGDKDTVLHTIRNARRGVMPTWQGRLDDATIKQLTLYVHALGGGE